MKQVKIRIKGIDMAEKMATILASNGYIVTIKGGNYNIGNSNTGNGNIGRRNAGDKNAGNCNSGDRNSGNFNTGDWNSGHRNCGIFNTRVERTIDIFDLPSDWTMDDWYNSRAKKVMDSCPYSHNEIIMDELMLQKEKKEHPEYKTVGFFIKCIEVTNEERQKWWDELPDRKKQYVYDLPNFNAEKFLECTGIDVNKVAVRNLKMNV